MDSRNAVNGKPGDLDSTFGTNGIVLTPAAPAGGETCATSVAIQADGKIVICGLIYEVSNGYRFALARYDTNGGLDKGFGEGGIVKTPAIWVNGYGAVAIQPDGKIVATTTTYERFQGQQWAVVRYEADGSLDTHFGSNGMTSFRAGEDNLASIAAAIAVVEGGKILVGGRAIVGGGDVFGLVRFNADGTLDATFGDGGTVTTRVGSGASAIAAFVIQSTGRVVAVGRAVGNDGAKGFGLARYRGDGSLDETFGNRGTVYAKVNNRLTGDLFGAAVLPDDSIVTAGPEGQPPSDDPGAPEYVMAIMRHDASGKLDTSFGEGGLVSARVGTKDAWACSVVVARDGKIVVGGRAMDGEAMAFGVVRLLPDGKVDEAFGQGGQVVTKAGIGDSDVRAMALQVDGKIVAVGTGDDGSDFALARYLGG